MSLSSSVGRRGADGTARWVDGPRSDGGTGSDGDEGVDRDGPVSTSAISTRLSVVLSCNGRGSGSGVSLSRVEMRPVRAVSPRRAWPTAGGLVGAGARTAVAAGGDAGGGGGGGGTCLTVGATGATSRRLERSASTTRTGRGDVSGRTVDGVPRVPGGGVDMASAGELPVGVENGGGCVCEPDRSMCCNIP